MIAERMILTLTLDPVVEYLFPVPGLQLGRAYRPESMHTAIFGAALNVARVDPSACEALAARLEVVEVEPRRSERRVQV